MKYNPNTELVEEVIDFTKKVFNRTLQLNYTRRKKMLQNHTMILWSHARKMDFQTVTNRAYKIMQAFRNFGPELNPNYLTVSRKKDTKLFDWTFENFEEVLKKGVNREGKNVFPDLGYSLSYFSSLTDKDSAGISIKIGVENSNSHNTLVVNLHQSFPIYESILIQ